MSTSEPQQLEEAQEEAQEENKKPFTWNMLPPPPRCLQKEAAAAVSNKPKPPSNPTAVLIYSPAYAKVCCAHEIYLNRDVLFWSLFESCGLAQWARLVPPKIASEDSLLKFHSKDYIAALKSNDSDNGIDLADYELENDCALFDRCWEMCRLVAGASLTAADFLVRGTACTAINWGGGRHHAKKSNASGFCYVNDAVLAIQHLQRKFERVLYLDIDVHHGDGVEEAFYSTANVMCVSFHKLAAGYFPGTGQQKTVGAGKGRYYNVNVPLNDGISDADFVSIFDAVFDAAVAQYQPHAIVMCCGVDTLSRDRLGTFNLTSSSICHCVGRCAALARGGQKQEKGVACRRNESLDAVLARLHDETFGTPESVASASDSTSASASAAASISAFVATVAAAPAPAPAPAPTPARVPFLLLGGGGYHPTDTARCWLLATAAAISPGILAD